MVEAGKGCFGSLRDPDSLGGLFMTRNDDGETDPAIQATWCYPDFLNHLHPRNCAENVTIDGYNATFRMRKYDYMNKTLYSHSEDRFGFAIYRAKNFTLRGMTVTLTGGDGLYVVSDQINSKPAPSCLVWFL